MHEKSKIVEGDETELNDECRAVAYDEHSLLEEMRGILAILLAHKDDFNTGATTACSCGEKRKTDEEIDTYYKSAAEKEKFKIHGIEYAKRLNELVCKLGIYGIQCDWEARFDIFM